MTRERASEHLGLTSNTQGLLTWKKEEQAGEIVTFAEGTKLLELAKKELKDIRFSSQVGGLSYHRYLTIESWEYLLRHVLRP